MDDKVKRHRAIVAMKKVGMKILTGDRITPSDREAITRFVMTDFSQGG